MLVGHAVHHDLRALRLDYQPVIDTSLLLAYRHRQSFAFEQNHLHCRHMRGSSSCIGLLSNTLSAPADVAAWFCTEYLASWVSFVVNCPFCEK